jgi:hypothetical protein
VSATFAHTSLARRLRWRRRLARAADLAFALVLLATLALALAPLAANLLRSDVLAAIDAETVWSAERSVGGATAMLTGRLGGDEALLPAVDGTLTTLAGLR